MSYLHKSTFNMSVTTKISKKIRNLSITLNQIQNIIKTLSNTKISPLKKKSALECNNIMVPIKRSEWETLQLGLVKAIRWFYSIPHGENYFGPSRTSWRNSRWRQDKGCRQKLAPVWRSLAQFTSDFEVEANRIRCRISSLNPNFLVSSFLAHQSWLRPQREYKNSASVSGYPHLNWNGAREFIELSFKRTHRLRLMVIGKLQLESFVVWNPSPSQSIPFNVYTTYVYRMGDSLIDERFWSYFMRENPIQAIELGGADRRM